MFADQHTPQPNHAQSNHNDPRNHTNGNGDRGTQQSNHAHSNRNDSRPHGRAGNRVTQAPSSNLFKDTLAGLALAGVIAGIVVAIWEAADQMANKADRP